MEFVIFIGGVVSIVGVLAAIFPEIRSNTVNWIYRKTHLGQNPLVIDRLFIDNMSAEHGFIACTGSSPGGYYYDLDSRYAPYQQFIKLRPEHEVIIDLRKNDYVKGPITIKAIYLDVFEVTHNDFESFFADAEGCGAGVSEKIYSVEKNQIEKVSSSTLPYTIKAVVDPANEQKFTFIQLDSQNPVDYVRIYIPGLINKIIGFKVRFIFDTESGEKMLSTGNLFIGNTSWANNWWETEIKKHSE